jgi:hypothetical protein
MVLGYKETSTKELCRAGACILHGHCPGELGQLWSSSLKLGGP